MNYEELLQHSYEVEQSGANDPGTRFEYVAVHIFDFTTYDSGMDEIMGTHAMEVFEAITNRKTFEYINAPEKYQWYTIMVNMPFFVDRLNWGTSIRGAWWDAKQRTISSCGLWMDGEHIEGITFQDDEWDKFAAALIKWVKNDA